MQIVDVIDTLIPGWNPTLVKLREKIDALK
jgi:hypothetical protein